MNNAGIGGVVVDEEALRASRTSGDQVSFLVFALSCIIMSGV